MVVQQVGMKLVIAISSCNISETGVFLCDINHISGYLSTMPGSVLYFSGPSVICVIQAGHIWYSFGIYLLFQKRLRVMLACR